jgi:hypothetical protein
MDIKIKLILIRLQNCKALELKISSQTQIWLILNKMTKLKKWT